MKLRVALGLKDTEILAVLLGVLGWPITGA